MLNIATGFGREIKDREDIRKDPRFSFFKKPEEEGKMGLNKYGDFLGFGKQAEEEPYLGGYQSPFTTLTKQGWQYDGNQLTSQAERDRMAGKFGPENLMSMKPKQAQPTQPKFGQPKISPYPAIMESYKRI